MNVGTPERLGGSPRTNEDDAYATFMDMDDEQWLWFNLSMLKGGSLQMAEQRGWERALEARRREEES